MNIFSLCVLYQKVVLYTFFAILLENEIPTNLLRDLFSQR